MNGKKAKRLRKDARILSQGLDEVNYETTNHNTYTIPLNELDKDGKPIVVKVHTYTGILGACVRAKYKELKKLHKRFGNLIKRA